MLSTSTSRSCGEAETWRDLREMQSQNYMGKIKNHFIIKLKKIIFFPGVDL